MDGSVLVYSVEVSSHEANVFRHRTDFTLDAHMSLQSYSLGEGCCSTTLTGPGKVYMQSMNFQKFKEAVTVTVMEDDTRGGDQQ